MSFLKKPSIINKLIFPAPASSYSAKSFPHNTLIWIPEHTIPPSDQTNPSNLTEPSTPLPQPTACTIPCILLSRPAAEFLIIFCHGNGDDLGGAFRFLRILSEYMSSLGIHLSFLAVEYPGYGLYRGNTSEAGVHLAVHSAYVWACERWPLTNIWLWGVSIGTGPVTRIAARHECGGLVLTAAYESIRAVVKHMLGSAAQYLITNRFDNIAEIENVVCPVMFIHGEKDQLIPCSQSLQLFEHVRSEIKLLFIADGVGHTNFNMERDIIQPLFQFYNRLLAFRKELGLQVLIPAPIQIPEECLVPPDNLPATPHLEKKRHQKKKSGSWKSWFWGRRNSDVKEEEKDVDEAPFQVSKDLLDQLVGMGFCAVRSEHALRSTDNNLALSLELLLT